jgi:hypothetical protein
MTSAGRAMMQVNGNDLEIWQEIRSRENCTEMEILNHFDAGFTNAIGLNRRPSRC